MLRSFASATAVLAAAVIHTASAQTTTFPQGVLASGTMGPNNPPEPTMGTSINQTSYARLLSVNSIDDFCLFAPPTMQNISDSETFEVAWCTQPRNNARVIPDGTLTGLSFLKTDFYVQVYGYGDFTKLNIPYGDYGGELDPHGAYGSGNPVGGNVTSNITGSNQHFQEWMLYIDYNQFCLRVCTNANSTYSAEAMCWHELDEMGCQFVMPGNYNFNNTFESCDAEVAYPPGWYPAATVSGSTTFSEFAQYFTGQNPDGSGYTVGDTITPAAPYMTPSSSNCDTTATVSNGIALNLLGVTGSAPSGPAATGASASRTAGTTKQTGAASANSSTGSSNGASRASSQGQVYPLVTFFALFSGLAAVVLFH